MVLRMFSPTYFLMIIITVLIVLFFNIWLKSKDQQFIRVVISIMFFASFALHFLKLVFPPYNSDPLAMRKVTPENICAISTLVFPFIFLFSKSKVLKDYMFYFGILGGTLALILPLEQLNNNFFSFEVIRFYFAHIVLIVGPYLMVSKKLHILDYRRILKVPLVFFGVLAIIIVNEVILTEIGLVPLRGDDLFNHQGYRNFSLIFGVNSQLAPIEDFLKALTPSVFLKIPFGEFAGQEKYWPLIWLVVPSYLLIVPACVVLSIHWEKDRFKSDFNNLFNKIKCFLRRKDHKCLEED